MFMGHFKEKMKKRETYFKFLFSYMFVFLVPVIIVLTYFYPETGKIIKNESINSEMILLSNIDNFLSIQLNSILSSSTTIDGDADLNSHVFSDEGEFGTYLVMEELRKVFGSNSFINRAFLYGVSTGKFYSFTGTYSKRDFCRVGSSFYYESWKRTDIFNTLTNARELYIKSTEKIILPYGNDMEGVTFFVPVPLGNMKPYAILMVIVEEEKFFSSLDEHSDSGDILILDEDYEILTRKNRALDLTGFDISSRARLLDSGDSILMAIGGEEFIISLYKSELFPLSYMSLTPVDDLLVELNSVKLKAFILVCITFSLGSITYKYLYENELWPHKDNKETNPVRIPE